MSVELRAGRGHDHSRAGEVGRLGQAALLLQDLLQALLVLPHHLPTGRVQRPPREHAADEALDLAGGPMASSQPPSVHRAVPDALDAESRPDQFPCAAVPKPCAVAVLDLRRGVVHSHQLQGRPHAAPVSLDADRGRDGVRLDALRSKIAVPDLDGGGSPVVEHTEHERPQHHVVEHNGQQEGAVVVRGAVGHLEQLVRDGNVAALPHGPAHGGAVHTAENRLHDTVLPHHEVAELLQDAQRGVPIEVGQQASLGQVRKLVAVRGHYLAEIRALFDGFVHVLLVLPLLPRRSLGLGLGFALRRALGLRFHGRFRLLGFGRGLFQRRLLLHERLDLGDVNHHLCRQGRHSAVILRPIQRQPMVHLATEHLHELSPSARIQALELQVVLRGDAGGVQSLAHCHQHLGGEVHVPVLCRHALQDEHGQALAHSGDQPIVMVLHCADILPQSVQAVSGMRRQVRVLADWNDLPRKGALDGAQIACLMADRVASPLDRRRELLGGQVGQQVPGHRQQEVGGEVDVSALVVVQAGGTVGAQAAAAELFARQLARDRHEADGALQRRLDLHQHLLDLFGQVAEVGVHEVPHRGRCVHDGNEHRANPLVRLALLPLNIHAPLEVPVASEIALDEQGGCPLQLLPDQLQPALSHRLQALV
mmetsp:Transcript_24929/g.71530  ORF Transcript_24929/g.71530 Transcript_24929/m.71530 type:complete len:650 (+) Transcript_24929:585-2534(+)